jgi:DNA repair photolyase
MKPIYVPSGKAKEYGDYALNIYTGCPHECYYCFAPQVLHRDKEAFHGIVQPREGIIEATRKQLERDNITDKLIHLCFTCDPYPNGHDSSVTREIIKLLKEHGNHVQILTKNGKDAMRDFDLLDENDWFGVTLTGATTEQEPNATDQQSRIFRLAIARNMGIKTWVSFEPVLNAEWVLSRIAAHGEIFDKIKIGKLNYHPSSIDWADFGRRAEELCKTRGFNYYIKDSLRAEMERDT